jgi:SAM-dependent MidA family methyltransferase
LFGELLAFQFAEWFLELEVQNRRLEASGTDVNRLQIIEAGAHDGRLAADILHWFERRRPDLLDRVEYCLLEPSPTRQSWQRQTLAPFAPRVRWTEQLPRPLTQDSRRLTCFFSNELLDAFPVHRVGWDAKSKRWFEWGVANDSEKFVWARLPITHHASRITESFPSAILEVLPDGFTTEVCPTAENWWREAAAWLPHGKLLTLDYGLESEEFFTPQRTHGTVRAYHRHKLSDDLLARPGEQDLTAHVNFTAIKRAGESAGLRNETDITQARFLTDIAQRAWGEGSNFGSWTPERTRQFQTLTHPNHLGRAFRVLVQTK